jgi:hypothetical protein
MVENNKDKVKVSVDVIASKRIVSDDGLSCFVVVDAQILLNEKEYSVFCSKINNHSIDLEVSE